MAKIWILFLLLGWQNPLLAGSDSLYMQAGNMYEEERYEEAIELYLSIEEGGQETADLYYNMGNAYFRSNQIASAILYFEKTLKLDPAHEDAAHNLEFVSRYRMDSFEELPVFFLARWKESFTLMFSERTWSIIALGSFILFLVLVLVFLFSGTGGFRRTAFSSAIAVLLIFLLSFSTARSRYSEIRDASGAIVMTPSVIVRSSPSETGTELFILHEGTKVDVREDLGGWQNIRIPDGREGWLLKRDISHI